MKAVFLLAAPSQILGLVPLLKNSSAMRPNSPTTEDKRHVDTYAQFNTGLYIYRSERLFWYLCNDPMIHTETAPDKQETYVDLQPETGHRHYQEQMFLWCQPHAEGCFATPTGLTGSVESITQCPMSLTVSV